jgi:hypothetical protein
VYQGNVETYSQGNELNRNRRTENDRRDKSEMKMGGKKEDSDEAVNAERQ